MRTHRKTRPGSKVNSFRLFDQEIGRIKNAFTRYAKRAVSVALDIEQGQKRKRAVHRIARIERDLLFTLSKLEEKVRQ